MPPLGGYEVTEGRTMRVVSIDQTAAEMDWSDAEVSGWLSTSTLTD